MSSAVFNIEESSCHTRSAQKQRREGKATVLVLGVLIVVKTHVERELLPEGFYLRVL
jgi:hypothetical protein